MRNKYINKHWFINKKYLNRIWFIEISTENYVCTLHWLTIIYCNTNLYFSKKWDLKSTFFCNVNYKNIEDKFSEILCIHW